MLLPVWIFINAYNSTAILKFAEHFTCLYYLNVFDTNSAFSQHFWHHEFITILCWIHSNVISMVPFTHTAFFVAISHIGWFFCSRPLFIMQFLFCSMIFHVGTGCNCCMFYHFHYSALLLQHPHQSIEAPSPSAVSPDVPALTLSTFPFLVWCLLCFCHCCWLKHISKWLQAKGKDCSGRGWIMGEVVHTKLVSNNHMS